MLGTGICVATLCKCVHPHFLDVTKCRLVPCDNLLILLVLIPAGLYVVAHGVDSVPEEYHILCFLEQSLLEQDNLVTYTSMVFFEHFVPALNGEIGGAQRPLAFRTVMVLLMILELDVVFLFVE
jgi:hypothetical protein